MNDPIQQIDTYPTFPLSRVIEARGSEDEVFPGPGVFLVLEIEVAFYRRCAVAEVLLKEERVS